MEIKCLKSAVTLFLKLNSIVPCLGMHLCSSRGCKDTKGQSCRYKKIPTLDASLGFQISIGTSVYINLQFSYPNPKEITLKIVCKYI